MLPRRVIENHGRWGPREMLSWVPRSAWAEGEELRRVSQQRFRNRVGALRGVVVQGLAERGSAGGWVRPESSERYIAARDEGAAQEHARGRGIPTEEHGNRAARRPARWSMMAARVA